MTALIDLLQNDIGNINKVDEGVCKKFTKTINRYFITKAHQNEIKLR